MKFRAGKSMGNSTCPEATDLSTPEGGTTGTPEGGTTGTPEGGTTGTPEGGTFVRFVASYERVSGPTPLFWTGGARVFFFLWLPLENN